MIDHCFLDISPMLFLTGYHFTTNTKTTTGTEEIVKCLRELAVSTEGLGSVPHTRMADHNYKYRSKGFNVHFQPLKALQAYSKYSGKQAYTF